jgi:diadenosine tetraphosphate (Ap4A) HIT family hydrolase
VSKVTGIRTDGLTIGVNAGAAAGQTVDHVHLHIVPRHVGDVADPRGGIRWVLPERAAYWEDG